MARRLDIELMLRPRRRNLDVARRWCERAPWRDRREAPRGQRQGRRCRAGRSLVRLGRNHDRLGAADSGACRAERSDRDSDRAERWHGIRDDGTRRGSAGSKPGSRRSRGRAFASRREATTSGTPTAFRGRSGRTPSRAQRRGSAQHVRRLSLRIRNARASPTVSASPRSRGAPGHRALRRGRSTATNSSSGLHRISGQSLNSSRAAACRRFVEPSPKHAAPEDTVARR